MSSRPLFQVWDNRECVSHHSTALDAHLSIRRERDPRTFTLYDPTGRVVAMYRDGRELVGDLDGSAF
jgi:hypothetical protein